MLHFIYWVLTCECCSCTLLLWIMLSTLPFFYPVNRVCGTNWNKTQASLNWCGLRTVPVFFTSDVDGSIRLYDARSGCFQNQLFGHSNWTFCKFDHGYTQSYKSLQFFCLLSTLTHAANFAILKQNVHQGVARRLCAETLAFFISSSTLRQMWTVLQETISHLLRQIFCMQFTFPSYIT